MRWANRLAQAQQAYDIKQNVHDTAVSRWGSSGFFLDGVETTTSRL